MIVKNIIDEDVTNYHRISMFIGFPTCTFKCERDCGIKMCQNSALVHAFDYEISCERLVQRYLNNPMTSAMVCGGLEPFDSCMELLDLLKEFRKYTDDDFVIYTGYNKNEIEDLLEEFRVYKNVVVKFGRFCPYQGKHYDEVLGVYLASDNQYAERIS